MQRCGLSSPEEVLAELELRKRRLGILHFDDLLSGWRTRWSPRTHRPANGCASGGAIVMVDEFQDTDPVQWQVDRPRVRRPLDA